MPKISKAAIRSRPVVRRSTPAAGLKVALTLFLTMTLATGWTSPPALGAEFRDETGRLVQLTGPPERIVTLSPSLTEVVFALGLGDKVVGVTRWSNVPPEANKLPKVGAYISPNLEMIAALEPDLVLANRDGNPAWVVDKLSRSGIPVYVTRPDDPLVLPDSIRRLGQACGAPAAGQRLARALGNEFSNISVKLAGVKPVRCLLIVGSKPVVAAGDGSFHGKLLNLVGAQNLAAGAPGIWPRLSLEFVVQSRPEVLIISTMERGSDADGIIAHWRSVPGLEQGSGVRIETVPSDLLDRPGPRVGQGLAALASALHPHLFPAAKGAGR